jgi:c-di-AMP phosphodiesterase-like protein
MSNEINMFILVMAFNENLKVSWGNASKTKKLLGCDELTKAEENKIDSLLERYLFHYHSKLKVMFQQ